MAASTLERKDGAWLQGHAHDWVAAGLISADQAESIKHFEHLDEPVVPQRKRLRRSETRRKTVPLARFGRRRRCWWSC